jgi:transposase
MEGNGSGTTSAVLLGLSDVVVVSAGVVGGEVELLIETTARVTGCPRCGVLARPHGRRPVLVRDLPMCGRSTLLVWSKRVWRCLEPRCSKCTWSETHPQFRPRAALTVRAQLWAMQRVGQHGETVISVARQLGDAPMDGKPPQQDLLWVRRLVAGCGRPPAGRSA